MPKSVAEVIQLAEIKHNPMRPYHLDTDLVDAVSNLVLLQLYAQQSLQQADFPATSRQPAEAGHMLALKQHQLVLKRNAGVLVQSIVPAVVTGLTDVLAYSSTLKVFGDSILKLMPAMVADANARRQVLALVAQLDAAACHYEHKMRVIDMNLSNIAAKVAADHDHLQADIAELDSHRNHPPVPAHQELCRQISALLQHINTDIAGVIGSAVLTELGEVVLHIGSMGCLSAAQPFSTTVMIGLGLSSAGLARMASTAASLQADHQRLIRQVQQLAEISLALPLQVLLTNQNQMLSDASTGLTAAVGSLATQWGAIHVGLEHFHQQIIRSNDDSDTAHLIVALRLAQQHWKGITEQTQGLLSRLVDLTPRQTPSVTHAQPGGNAQHDH